MLNDYTQPAARCTSAVSTAFSRQENEGGTTDGVGYAVRTWRSVAYWKGHHMGIAINAHYDGKVIVPDEPLDLPPNQPLVVGIDSISRAGLADESALTWIAENSCDSPQLRFDLSHQHDRYLYGIPKKDPPATGL